MASARQNQSEIKSSEQVGCQRGGFEARKKRNEERNEYLIAATYSMVDFIVSSLA